MRESRQSGSVEGVMSNHDPYSDSGIGVGLENALEISQMVGRVLSRPVRRVEEDGGGRSLTAEGAVVANIGPQSAGDGLDLGQHRHRGVVAMEAVAAHDMLADQFGQRRQGRGAGADPIGQGRDAEIEPFTPEALGLTVQGLVIAIFAIENHRQQAGPGPAAQDRMKRRRLLGDLFTGPAAELLAHGLDYLVAARDDFQRLGDILADLGKLAAAVRASAGAGQHVALARQVGRQRPARRALAGDALDHAFGLLDLGCGGCALVFGGGRLQLFKLQFQLVEQIATAFRALTEALTPELGDLQPKMLDHHLGAHGPCLGLRGLSLGQSKRCAQAFDGFGWQGGRHGHAKYIITKPG